MSKKICFLSDLLSHSGSSLTETAVEELMRGVAAAPEGYNPEDWHALITKKPTEETAVEGAEGEASAEGAEAAKEGDVAKKDEKGKDGASDKKPEEKKSTEKKPADKK